MQSQSTHARFWAKIDKSGDCWIWTAGKSASGYGQFFPLHGVMVRAHRFAYEEAFGPIPAGLLVCHRCDVRACVRPDHLFLGTHGDNSADMKAKGRSLTGDRSNPRRFAATAARGEAMPQARLTEESVRDIRARRALGQTYVSIARRFGVDHSTIRRAVVGQTWRHLG